MSRRARRRAKKPKGSKWLVGIVVALLVMIVALAVVQTMIRRYLQSDEFRLFLSGKVSEAINADGEFKPLRWDGLAVRSDGFEAEGNEQLLMVDVQDLETEIGLGGFWRGVWEVKGFEIRQVDLEIDARSGVVPPAKVEKEKKKSRWLPSEVELENMKIERVSVKALLDSGPLTLKDAKIEAVPGNGRQNYEVKMTGGKLAVANEKIPDLKIEEANLKYKDGAVYLTDADARFWDYGRLELTGEWDPSLDIRAAQGTVSGVTCDQLVNEDWKKRLRGKLKSDFEVTWSGDEPIASGHLELQDGVLTALPVLEIMEAYLDTTRFRVLNLNEAHADWKWREGRWSVSNVVVHSEGLMRLEGGMKVIGENLDGHFRLGLPPGTLARIPGAEKHVFLAGERGMRWANVRVTGTLSEPKHDLTDQLFAAASRRILEALPEATLESLLLGKDIIDVSTRNAVQGGIQMLEGGPALLDKILKDGPEGILESGLKGLLEGGGQGGNPGGLIDGILKGF